MTWPNIAAGQRITAGLLNSMMPVYVIKPADTSRSGTTDLADPDLTFTLAANARYRIDATLWYACANFGLTPSGSAAGPAGTGGFTTSWTVPAGSSSLRSAVGFTSPAGGPGTANTIDIAQPIGTGRFGVHGNATSVAYQGRNGSNQSQALEHLDIITTSGGDVTLNWSQFSLNATTLTRLAARSMLKIQRVA